MREINFYLVLSHCYFGPSVRTTKVISQLIHSVRGQQGFLLIFI